MLIKKFITLSSDFKNFIKEFIALQETQEIRLGGCPTRFNQSNYRKLPNIGLGLISGERSFLVGVYSGGSISGWV